MDYMIIQYMLPIVEAMLKGYCFSYLVKPFLLSGFMPDGICAMERAEASAVKHRKCVFCFGAVYFFVMLLLYIIPLHMRDHTAYEIGSVLMFSFLCRIDRRNYRQKAFLVVVFFSLNCLSAAIAEILYDSLYAFTEKTDYMKHHPDWYFILYVVVCAFYLSMEFIFTMVGIRQVLKVYRNKSAEMEIKELIMLVLPSLMGVMAYQIIQSHRMVYFLEVGKKIDDNDIFIMLFYAAVIITIIIMIILYQKIKASQEENLQAELLAMQIGSIRRHMEQVESLYQDIRGIKHDMTNHILTLERLYEGHKVEEAKAYGKDLKRELARMTGGIESGNPVTDVILQEFQKEAEKREISFHSEFHFPTGSNINVFDISVILNNALQNAIENTDKEPVRQISVDSYRRNNAYIIEICNSFTGNLQWDMENGFPITSKEKKDHHGYGLPNIRRVAGKYAGDIDIRLKEKEFCLCILLMLE